MLGLRRVNPISRYEEDATKEFNNVMANLRQRIQEEMTLVITSLADATKTPAAPVKN